MGTKRPKVRASEAPARLAEESELPNGGAAYERKDLMSECLKAERK